jgi:ribonuclease D
MEYKLINNQQDLQYYVDKIKKSKYIAVDTEFLRIRTYYPELCLIQICYEKGHAIVIDALAGLDIKGILDILYDDNIIKIFHSPRQDIEIFYHMTGKIPQNIFDTQVAVMALNQQKDLSYEKLVKIFLNKDLDKALKTSNWQKRPLSNAQVAYAAADVLYLFEAYEVIYAELSKNNKLEWLKGMFNYYLNPLTYEASIEKQAQKIITYHFNQSEVNLCLELLRWRDTLAKKLNVARGMLVSNDNIKAIVTKHVILKEDLLNFLDENIYNDYADDIFEIILNQNNQIIEDSSDKKPTDINDKQQEILTLCQMVLKYVAQDLSTNQILIATDEELVNFILNPSSSSSLLKDWKYDVLGKHLQAFLLGETSLVIEDGRPKLKSM